MNNHGPYTPIATKAKTEPYGVVGLRRDYEAALAENARLRTLLTEADRLLSMEGIVFDPSSLRAQIAEALNQQTQSSERR